MPSTHWLAHVWSQFVAFACNCGCVHKTECHGCTQILFWVLHKTRDDVNYFLTLKSVFFPGIPSYHVFAMSYISASHWAIKSGLPTLSHEIDNPCFYRLSSGKITCGSQGGKDASHGGSLSVSWTCSHDCSGSCPTWPLCPSPWTQRGGGWDPDDILLVNPEGSNVVNNHVAHEI